MGREQTDAVERETDWLKIMVAGAFEFLARCIYLFAY